MKVLEMNVEMVADLIGAHTTTLVFANTRKMTETLVQKLRPYLGIQSQATMVRWIKESGSMLNENSN